MLTIREITADDAEGFLDLCLALDAESTFMMYEPGERTTREEEQRETILAVRNSPNSTILVAVNDDTLVGYVAAYGVEYNRMQHVATITAGVRRDFAGQGIGRSLFESLDTWAREQGLHRLELTVQAHNTAAIRLYERMGFQIEGRRRDAMRIAGTYVDELYMAKLL